jgi:hypothetical protein
MNLSNNETGLRIVQNTVSTPGDASVFERLTREPQGCIAEAVKLCPMLGVLRARLQSLGGEELYVDHYIQVGLIGPMLRDGFVQDGPVVEFPVRLGGGSVRIPRQCHANVVRLWTAKHPTLVGIGTGYALYGPYWHRHTWGILNAEGGLGERLLETSPVGWPGWTRYFGLALKGREADQFAASEFNFGAPYPLPRTKQVLSEDLDSFLSRRYSGSYR